MLLCWLALPFSLTASELSAHYFRHEGLWHGEKLVDAAHRRYQALQRRIAAELDSRHTSQEQIALLNKVLLEDFVILYSGSDYWRDASLVHLLLERTGNCWAQAVLYFLMAREFDLPVALVRQPDHILVRWQDPTYTVDIETTDFGSIHEPDPEARIIASQEDFSVELLRRECRWRQQTGPGAVEAWSDNPLVRFWWRLLQRPMIADAAQADLAQKLLEQPQAADTAMHCHLVLARHAMAQEDWFQARTQWQRLSEVAHAPMRRYALAQHRRLQNEIAEPTADTMPASHSRGSSSLVGE